MRLIDADKALEHIKKRLLETALNNTRVVCDAAYLYADISDNRIETWINEAPTVDAEPVRHGKWIEKRTYSGERPIGEWQSCKCSVCGRYDTRPYLYYFSKPNFCSWCGAEMIGEEE